MSTPLQNLSPYERRLWFEIDRILYQNYLTPRTITDFWKGDRDAVVWHLKQLKDRVIRTIIIVEYVEVDDLLNRTILRHAFPGKANVRRRKSYRLLREMLDRLYLAQKVEILRSATSVPDAVVSSIMALNTIRNSFAHRFDLAAVPPPKRFYKGKHNVFTRSGLKKFKNEMFHVHELLEPETLVSAMELVKLQRARNRRFRRAIAQSDA